MVRICFVCLGNICRSPTAEGIMLNLVAQAGLDHDVKIDSAGTAAYHTGEPPDRRSAATAQARGVELPSRARQFKRDDFERFEYVLAMDSDNAERLRELAPTPLLARRVQMLREYQPGADELGSLDVPDPYYGGARGFEDVYDMCEASCQALLEHIRAERGTAP